MGGTTKQSMYIKCIWGLPFVGKPQIHLEGIIMEG